MDLTRRLEEIVAEFASDGGSIHMIEPDGMLHAKAWANIPEVVQNITRVIPRGKGMAGLAWERSEPITACNIQTDASGNVRPGAKATGMEGALVVPVLRGDDVVGTLGIANRTERTFTEEEKALLIARGRELAAE